ncbi:transporter substrate-binding domain-containing protein [Catenulispora pinisilvae]|uniref:transporter substrate-binding domain-containing protein n=1 Tax=Catenulispora pinisilvae TaxID=2705253 RepID=UPI001890DD0D
MPVTKNLFRFAVPAFAVVLLASACSSGASGTKTDSAPAAAGTTVVRVGSLSNGAATEADITVAQQDALRAELPAAIRSGGTLKVAVGALPAGFPPLAYVGSDQKTLTGSEPDLARLVAAVLGLKPSFDNATWDNMFVGIDSGKDAVGFANITDTEQRKQKYDFASYRDDNLGFETLKSSTWSFTGDYHALAGKTVAVSSGTNQEKILLEWQSKLRTEGKDINIKYYPDSNAVLLALTSGKIDIYLGPNPGVAYQVTQTSKSPNPTRIAGEYSGAGETLQGLIGATTKKDSGLAKPIADAVNYLIQNGDYGKWLAAWNLSTEAVKTSQVNPPGLPASNS